MVSVISAIGSLFGLVAFVLGVFVAVKMIQAKKTGLGIATIVLLFCVIGHILALIFGWQNKNSWGLQKIMPIYTIALLIGFTSQVVVLPSALAEFRKAFEEQQQQMQQQATEEYGDVELPDFNSQQ